jgi:hypothetical protein
VSEGKNEAAVTAKSFGDDTSVLGGKNNKEVSAMTNGIGDESVMNKNIKSSYNLVTQPSVFFTSQITIFRLKMYFRMSKSG